LTSTTCYIDVIVVSGDAVDINSSEASVYGEWSFKDNIMETSNTPSTPDEGLTVSTEQQPKESLKP
jgi:hypothetical protein